MPYSLLCVGIESYIIKGEREHGEDRECFLRRWDFHHSSGHLWSCHSVPGTVPSSRNYIIGLRSQLELQEAVSKWGSTVWRAVESGHFRVREEHEEMGNDKF